MTAAVLPEFILKLLEHELSKATLEVVEWVCQEYELPFEEVKKKLGKRMQLKLNLDAEKNYKVTRVTLKPTVEPEDQCVANILCKDQKCVRQCTKEKKKGNFCRLHYNMNKKNLLRYGVASKN